MALRRNPKKEKIEELKKTYIGWLNGISQDPERPDWAGENYLVERVEVWLANPFSYAFYKDDKTFENYLNNQVLHHVVLKELKNEESFWNKLSEKSKDVINELILLSDARIFHIDFKSLGNTRLIFREIALKAIKIPEKLDLSRMPITAKEQARNERIWSLVKGMKPTKIRDKLDKVIVWVYNHSLLWSEGEEREKKKLKKKLIELLEVRTMANWFVKSREDHLFPWIKDALNSRIELLDWIVENYLDNLKKRRVKP